MEPTPIASAPDCCALQEILRVIGAVGRVIDRLDQLGAAALHHHLAHRGQGLADREVGHDEEPAPGALLRHRVDEGARLGRGVDAPLHAGRRAALAGELGRRRHRGEEQPVLFESHALDGDRRRRGRHVDDHVDALDIVPLLRELDREVGLRLHIGRDHLDLLADHGAAEILGRQARGHHRALAHRGRGETGEIGEDADLHHRVARLGRKGRQRHRRQAAEQSRRPHRASPSLSQSAVHAAQ